MYNLLKKVIKIGIIMKRLVDDKILSWSKKENFLPLFILGARQIGKTYSVKKFATEYFTKKYIYINFLEKNEYYDQLKNITNPKDVIEIIRMISKKNIDESWLIIFDEIQETPELKTSLKNFVEQNLKYRIICLGSYLGNSLNNDKFSFPVGKIERIEMFPLNFEEFLISLGHEAMIPKIKESIEKYTPLENHVHIFLINLLHNFMIIGGMPKVISTFIKEENELKTFNLKKELINDYNLDITKYIKNNSDKMKCRALYKSIPTFLAKQNKKIVLSKIDINARYLNYANAIESLLETKIVYKINNINTFATPLKIHSNDSEFKIYYNDSGFLAANLNQTIKTIDDKTNGIIRGTIAENFALAELAQKIEIENIFYYSYNDENNNRYEIDFVIEDNNNNIIPIEIKYGEKFSIKSLKNLKLKFPKNNSIIFSSKNFNFNKNSKIISMPLYAIGFLSFSFNRINI